MNTRKFYKQSKGDKNMFKRTLAVLFIAASIFSIGVSDSSAKSTNCEHTFRIEVINGVKYQYEYSCDGSLVNVTVIED